MELVTTMFRELSSQYRKNNLAFCQVSTRDLNEAVFGSLSDLGSLRVDNWWQRKDGSVSVVEDWVLVLTFNNRQVRDQLHLLTLLCVSQHIEKLNAIHLSGLLKSFEFDILWSNCLICDWTFDIVIVMGSH
jgi:hypothetical protein